MTLKFILKIGITSLSLTAMSRRYNHLKLTCFEVKEQRKYNVKRKASSINGAGKFTLPHVKNELGH